MALYDFQASVSSIKEESGLQVLLRLESRPEISDVFASIFPQPHTPKARSIVEVVPCGAVQSTNLSLAWVAKCILPRQWDFNLALFSPDQYSVCLGGMGQSVVWIDCHGGFHVSALVRALEKYVKEKCGPSMFNVEVFTRQLLPQCLAMVHIVQCFSLEEYLLTMKTLLPRFLLHHRDVGMMVIDSVSDYFFIEKTYELSSVLSRGSQSSSLASLPSTNNNKSQPPMQQEVQNAWCILLRQLIHNFHLTVIAVKQDYYPSAVSNVNSTTENEDAQFQRGNDFMSLTWQNMITHRVELNNKTLKKYEEINASTHVSGRLYVRRGQALQHIRDFLEIV